MRHLWLIAALACFSGGVSHAERASVESVVLGGADGQVRVLMAGEVSADRLDFLLAQLGASQAKAVRFGVASNVPNRDEVIDRIRSATVGRAGWEMCSWLVGSPGSFVFDNALRALEPLGGSLVILDNGTNDEDRFHPAVGEDPNIGREENPILSGMMRVSMRPQVVQDETAYEGAWSLVYHYSMEGSCM